MGLGADASVSARDALPHLPKTHCLPQPSHPVSDRAGVQAVMYAAHHNGLRETVEFVKHALQWPALAGLREFYTPYSVGWKGLGGIMPSSEV